MADRSATADRERDALGHRAASSAGGLPGGACARTSWRPMRRHCTGPTNCSTIHGLRVFSPTSVAISIGTGLLFGLAPALRLSRLDVNTALKDGGRGGTGGRRGKQLSGAACDRRNGACRRAACGSGRDDPQLPECLSRRTVGAKTENILTMFLALPEAKYPRAEAQIAFFDRLNTRLQALPGVESAAIAWRPADERCMSAAVRAGRRAFGRRKQRRPTLSALVVGPAYFSDTGCGRARRS